jgi:hypothetical protein
MVLCFSILEGERERENGDLTKMAGLCCGCTRLWQNNSRLEVGSNSQISYLGN